MTALIHQRCLHHASREAVSRCPNCHLYFCRECVNEHDGKLICAGCLSKLAASAPTQAAGDLRMWSLIALGGVLLCWIVQYYFGWLLTQMPSLFHQVNS